MEDENQFAMPAADADFMQDGEDFTVPANEDEFLGNVDETVDAPILLGGPPLEAEESDAFGMVEDGSDEEEEAAEPTAMQAFNEGWQAILLERKDEENAKKAEILEAAQQSMDEFKAQRETKRDGRMATNRSDEQEKLEAIEADLENDNSWQRVCKMVELTHDSTEGAADVGRMKDVMIGLKNDSTRALKLGA